MTIVPFTATPLEEIPQIYDDLKKGFASGKTKDVAFRKSQLLKLAYLIKDNIDSFREALAYDLGRHVLEDDFLDISTALTEIADAYNNVEKWSKTEKAPFSVNWVAMSPAIRKEPKGTVMIIAPFNFPVFLLLGPLGGALAAGNTALIKPSELASATAALIGDLVPKYLDPEVVRVVNGAVPEVTKLLELKWDHILYTGSGRVARIISTAAAQHLTPVTTELGGKSPVVIDPKSDLKLAARRVLWGKICNAGQICVAPDYVLIPREVEDQFVKELQEVHATFFPEGPAKSESFARIISSSHAARLKRLIDETKGKIVVGGEVDVEKKYVAPTIVRDITNEDSLMSEEIFGPVLPIIAVKDVDEAIEFIRARDHPLALYIFSTNKKFQKKVIDNTQSGAAILNEVVIHVPASGLPFGGTGPSGSGATTGKYSFDIFTHLRATLNSPAWLDKFVFFGRFPPYTTANVNFLNRLVMPSLPSRPSDLPGGEPASKKSWGLWLGLVTLVGAASATVLANKDRLSAH